MTNEADKIIELAVFFKMPASNTRERMGRVRIIDNHKVEYGEFKGSQAERLRKVLKEMVQEESLELDVEEQIQDEEGNEIYVHKTKLVEKRDPLYVPAVQQYLRDKKFVTKQVVSQ